MNGVWNTIIKVCTLICLVASCSAEKPALIERKEKFYYGPNGVVKLVRVTRSQSIKEIALNYGVETEVLAKINGRPANGFITAGEVIKIPLSSNVQFEEQLFDEEQSSYTENIEETPLMQDESDLKEHRSEFALLTDEELDKDLRSIKGFNHKKLSQDELTIDSSKLAAKKGDFKYANPLNSKQFIWPVEGKVLSKYSKSGESFNEGINIAAPLGTVVRAAADGEVMYVGKEPKVYGNLVIIKHAGNYLTAYAHNDKINVKKGAKVKQGQPIATIGKTGAVSIPQLHFSMRKDKKTINPEG